METTVARAKSAGFDAYMLKPIEIGQFFGLLEQVCRTAPCQPSEPRPFITIRMPSP